MTEQQEWPTTDQGRPVTGTRPLTRDVRDPETSMTKVHVKRACNGCQGVLGDVTDEELSAVMAQRPLPDVTGECLRCTPKT